MKYGALPRDPSLSAQDGILRAAGLKYKRKDLLLDSQSELGMRIEIDSRSEPGPDSATLSRLRYASYGTFNIRDLRHAGSATTLGRED